VAQSDSPDPVRNGQALTYTVRVTNAGPDPAKAVRLVDRFSDRVRFLSARAPRATCHIVVTPTHPAEHYTIVNVVTVGKRKTDRRIANNTNKERSRVVNPPPVICARRAATIVGTNGDDALIGTSGRDVIAALSGNDDVIALGGDDIVCGSGGRDVVRAVGGDDMIKGGGGRDKLRGGDGNDRLQGKGDRDRLKGGRGDDVLRGGHGRDRCRGGGGSDIRRSC
jgi:uncharacterized repeat protein (TIGR01451 family)